VQYPKVLERKKRDLIYKKPVVQVTAGNLQMDIFQGCTYPVYRLVLLLRILSLIFQKRVELNHHEDK
jgi:hypothetical protein